MVKYTCERCGKEFSQKGHPSFFLILDLSSPYTSKNKLLKSFLQDIFCLRAITEDKCAVQ